MITAKLSPAANAAIMFVATIAAWMLGTFIKSTATGVPFEPNWVLVSVTSVLCTAVAYLNARLGRTGK